MLEFNDEGPSNVEEKLLKELGIKIDLKKTSFTF